MKCQVLFSGKNKKIIINLLSAELAKRVVKVTDNIWTPYCLASFSENLKFYFTTC